MDAQTEKQRMRRAVSERIQEMKEHEITAESRSLCKNVLELLPKNPVTIVAYFPLKTEVDTRPLLLALLERGDTLFLPHFSGKSMQFYQVTSLEELTKDDFSIPAPKESAPPLDPSSLQYALIPGRAFDAQGYRLGRGNGGYDRWIREQRKENSQTRFWGLALGCQIVKEIPHEVHDERVDEIITARGRIEVS